MAKTRNWDVVKALELHSQGLSDFDIATAVGTTSSNIRYMRSQHGLKKNPENCGEAGSSEGSGACEDVAEAPDIGRENPFTYKSAPEMVVSDAEDEEGVSDPYVYKGDMTPEAFRAMQADALADRKKELGGFLTAATLAEILQLVAKDAPEASVVTGHGSGGRVLSVEVIRTYDGTSVSDLVRLK